MSDMHNSRSDSAELRGAPAQNESLMMPRPGSLLAARREELGMTIEQAASHLNLAPRQVQAIEEENFAALPGMATARGFMRAYAKLLNIEPEPLLAAVANETSALDETIPLRRALPAKPFTESRLFSHERKRIWPMAVLVLLLAVLAVIGAEAMGWVSVLPPSVTALMHRGAMPAADNREGARAVIVTPPASSDAGRPTDAVQSPPVTAPESQAPLVAGQGQEDARGTAPAASAAAVDRDAKLESASDAKPAADERASGAQVKNGLTFKLREDSWIDIRKSDNSILISRLAKAGSTESFALDGPVSVVIGNASGVDATLRGEPLDLKAKAKNNVARLKLK